MNETAAAGDVRRRQRLGRSGTVLHVLHDCADEAIDVFHRVVEVRRGAQSRIRSIRRACRHDDFLVLRERLASRATISPYA
jgi:hypothetical protein